MVTHYHGNKSDSDSSDTEDESSDLSIESLKSDIALSPNDYDKHLKLVNFCKENGELVELRAARENFSKYFPLTEKLWLEWIEDEKTLCDTEESHENLVKLFERGIEDYLSPELWLEYIQYSIRWLSGEGGLQRFRSLCERAITCVGLHPEKGSAIWEVYRETESILEGEDKKEKVNSIFKRHVSIPIYGIDATYKEFKTFDQAKWKEAKAGYDAATLKLIEIENFEMELREKTAPKDLADVWSRYITYAKKKGDPVRLEFVYERATTQLCLNPQLWTEYMEWARKMKSPNMKLISKRATRNCGWEGKLWVLKLKILEEKSANNEELDSTITDALESLEGCSADIFIALWWQYVLCQKRNLQLEVSDDNKTNFRTAVKKAVKFIETTLAESFGDEIKDFARQIESFAARIEATFCEDMVRSRSKWEKLIKTTFGQDAHNWIEYAQLEVDFGTIENARKIFRKGVGFSKNNSEDLFRTALKFEKVYGTLDELESLEISIEKKKLELERREKREILEQKKSRERQERNAGTFAGKTKSKVQPMAFVKQVNSVESSIEDRLANLADIPQEKSNDEPPMKKPRSENFDNFAKPDFKSPFPAAPMFTPPVMKNTRKEPEKKKRPEKSKKIEDPNAPKFKKSETEEEKARTVYVSNLEYKLINPENEIRNIFIGCGEIEEVRLVRNGILFRGYGYVMFKTKEGADNALLRDRAKIQGRPAFVSKYAETVDKPKDAKKDFKFNDGKEDHRVFVKHPNSSLTRDQIVEIFGKCGTVIDVRLPETRTGQRKPLFYVEFATGLEASKASLTMHDTVVFGEKMEVKISCPPQRSQDNNKPEKKEMDLDKTPYGTPRSKFASLVPRNIKSRPKPKKTTEQPPKQQTKIPAKEQTENKTEPEKTEKKKGLSNSDFSKLFSS